MFINKTSRNGSCSLVYYVLICILKIVQRRCQIEIFVIWFIPYDGTTFSVPFMVFSYVLVENKATNPWTKIHMVYMKNKIHHYVDMDRRCFSTHREPPFGGLVRFHPFGSNNSTLFPLVSLIGYKSSSWFWLFAICPLYNGLDWGLLTHRCRGQLRAAT